MLTLIVMLLLCLYFNLCRVFLNIFYFFIKKITYLASKKSKSKDSHKNFILLASNF